MTAESQLIMIPGSLTHEADEQVVNTTCPRNGKPQPDAFCPHFANCSLPRLRTWAITPAEAFEYAQLAQMEDMIEPCLDGKSLGVQNPELLGKEYYTWKQDKAIQKGRFRH